VYALLVFLLCVASIYTLSVSLWRGPWRDMWEVMPFLEKALTGEAGWQDYWEQYGLSHRPLISKGLWVADLKWFAGSNHLLLAVSLFAQTIIFGVVYAFLRRDDSFVSWQRNTVLWCCVFCILSITQVFNFLHTFDVQWFLVTSSCMLSLACLLLPKNKTNVYLVSGWLLVFFASLNNFSGLVMWPVEVLLLVSLRYPSKSIAIFSLAIVAYLPLYFYQLAPAELLGDIRAHYAHKYGAEYPLNTMLRKALYCVDELTGFIIAVTLVRPSKKISDVEVKSVTKKLKDKTFAAQVDREQIKQCETLLGMPLNDFVALTLQAMQGIAADLGL
jgi:hypothetical protein